MWSLYVFVEADDTIDVPGQTEVVHRVDSEIRLNILMQP